jgi:hypothetical protein
LPTVSAEKPRSQPSCPVSQLSFSVAALSSKMLWALMLDVSMTLVTPMSRCMRTATGVAMPDRRRAAWTARAAGFWGMFRPDQLKVATE